MLATLCSPGRYTRLRPGRSAQVEELCVPVDPQPVGLQIDLNPHRAGIDDEPLRRALGDTYIDRAKVAVDYR